MRRVALLLAAGAGLALATGADLAAQDETPPLLVAYSTGAPTAEGDPDYRQIIYVAVPAGETRPLRLRLFDADVGGAYDTNFTPGVASFTRFAVYGGPAAFRGPDPAVEAGPDAASGFLLAERVQGPDPALDGGWTTLAELAPDSGTLFAGERLFRVQVDGLDGAEGNVFGFAAALEGGEPFAGLRVFAYDWSVRAEAPEIVLELPFTVPRREPTLRLASFDASGGSMAYAGPFRTESLIASENDRWREDEVPVVEDERGLGASLVFFGGREAPNDLSLRVEAINAAGAARRLPMGLPRRWSERNGRPSAQAQTEILSCTRAAFDAALSADREGAELAYGWRFHDGGEDRGRRVERAFPGPGTYPVRLEVRDGSPQASSASALRFEVTLPRPPVARIGSLPAVVSVGDVVRLDARGSIPGSDGAVVEVVRWLVDGTPIGDGAVLETSFVVPGLRRIDLEVEDDGGGPCSAARTAATVRVNARPVAEAGPPRTVERLDVVDLDAASSGDGDGNLLDYRWVVDAGSLARGPHRQVAFATAGTYEVALTVTDDTDAANASAADTTTVTVRERPGARPVADAGPDRRVLVGDALVVNGTGSADPNGSILDYRWSFGDGTSAVGPGAVHVYREVGRYRLSLAVRGSGHGEPVVERSIDVAVLPRPNQAPSADAGGDRAVQLGEPVLFDATGSTDADGRIVRYRWTFADGTALDGPAVLFAFVEPGAQRVSLTVTDDRGATAVDSVLARVRRR